MLQLQYRYWNVKLYSYWMTKEHNTSDLTTVDCAAIGWRGGGKRVGFGGSECARRVRRVADAQVGEVDNPTRTQRSADRQTVQW